MIWVLFLYINVQSLLAADLCSQVLTLDCENKYVAAKDEGVCGTNGMSYENFCYYSQAKCKDGTVNIQHVGLCSQNDTTNPSSSNVSMETTKSTVSSDDMSTITITTMSSDKLTVMATTTDRTNTDYNPLEHVFCSSVLSGIIRCTDELDPYCGTDGNFYFNKCHFESSKCQNSNLLEQPLEMCKGMIPNGGQK